MYISLFYGQVAHKNIELLSRVITDNSQSNLQFHSCFSQTTSSFSTAESSQQLFHSSQLTAAFTESAAQPNTTFISPARASRDARRGDALPPPPRAAPSGRPPTLLLLLPHASCAQSRGGWEPGAATGVWWAAARCRWHAAAVGAAGRQDIRSPWPSIRFGHPLEKPALFSHVSSLAISLNTWRALRSCAAHHSSPGVRKPEKYIMEGFKRAFSAPWPKTLRYQVTPVGGI